MKNKKKYIWAILTTDTVYGSIGMDCISGSDFTVYDSYYKALKELKNHYYPEHFYVKKLEVL
jgi:hypothetical protein